MAIKRRMSLEAVSSQVTNIFQGCNLKSSNLEMEQTQIFDKRTQMKTNKQANNMHALSIPCNIEHNNGGRRDSLGKCKGAVLKSIYFRLICYLPIMKLLLPVMQ